MYHVDRKYVGHVDRAVAKTYYILHVLCERSYCVLTIRLYIFGTNIFVLFFFSREENQEIRSNARIRFRKSKKEFRRCTD